MFTNFNYQRAEFIRRAYWNSAMEPMELARAWGCDHSTIAGIINGRSHTEQRPSVYREDVCLECPLTQCVYDVQDWPNKELLATCPLQQGGK